MTSFQFLDTLYKYDGPVVAVVADREGRTYLAAMIAENDDGERTYMAVPASRRRIANVCCNSTTGYEAFRFPEERRWYTFAYADAWNPAQVVYKLPDELPMCQGGRLVHRSPMRWRPRDGIARFVKLNPRPGSGRRRPRPR